MTISKFLYCITIYTSEDTSDGFFSNAKNKENPSFNKK